MYERLPGSSQMELVVDITCWGFESTERPINIDIIVFILSKPVVLEFFQLMILSFGLVEFTSVHFLNA
jgi:hypothetical protein